MHCHLLVPGFDWPQDEPIGSACARAPEALETLIARGRRTRTATTPGPQRWLFERFGVPRQRDWPAAPFSLLAEGASPGSDAWMCADPVHLRIERNRLLLADCTRFRIEREEADALAACINTHFGDILVVHPVQAQRWYARLPACPEVESAPLSSVRGGAIEARRAHGPEATRWQALANEVQMLLHDHPVNLAREQRDELPVNGVWLWGAGQLAKPSEHPFQCVAASDPLARGLAQASGARAQAPAANAQAWLAAAHDAGVVLVVLDALTAPSDYGQPEAWCEALSDLDRNWFAPLLAAIEHGDIGMLSLHLLGRDQALHAEVTRSDLRRFWRRRKPIAAWVAQALPPQTDR